MTDSPTRPRSNAVRSSRDGDQFHYHWAARQCLRLLDPADELACVTIEGSSELEPTTRPGEDQIDVALYFGSEHPAKARRVEYIQLKHSTNRANERITASEIQETLRAFSQRFRQTPASENHHYVFASNRRADEKLISTISDLAANRKPKHRYIARQLQRQVQIKGSQAVRFWNRFRLLSGEHGLWDLRGRFEVNARVFLPDADLDAPLRLKDLVTRKATTEFKTARSIRRIDVLAAFGSSENDLFPARCLIKPPINAFAREQEGEILRALLSARSPVVVHADGGIGKSVLSARLARAVPPDSVAILYDCYGNGLYRAASELRHRHKDALTEIANELAARGLCYPLVPTNRADEKQYMRAFLARVSQAVSSLRAHSRLASVCIIIDAADNAEMAAKERGESASFVNDLAQLNTPDGLRLLFTCRTHRRSLVRLPPGVVEFELLPFSEKETARHLRADFPKATDRDVQEFAYLTSSNPRVQRRALSQADSLSGVLRSLGPNPRTADDSLDALLQQAISKLSHRATQAEEKHINLLCEALAILRPRIPIRVLSSLTEISESAIRSFATDLHPSFLVAGRHLHFRDEPTETWFRKTFRPSSATVTAFAARLRPLAETSSYAAAMLPQLLDECGRLDELIRLALTSDDLPQKNALERRDVQLQRQRQALKAALRGKRHDAAARIALKAAGEAAGESRQNQLVQKNTDLAARFVESDRVEALLARRAFRATWQGSQHCYYAGLLSNLPEFASEAHTQLRMADEWLRAWCQRPSEPGEQHWVQVADCVELAAASMQLKGPTAAAIPRIRFLFDCNVLSPPQRPGACGPHRATRSGWARRAVCSPRVWL